MSWICTDCGTWLLASDFKTACPDCDGVVVEADTPAVAKVLRYIWDQTREARSESDNLTIGELITYLDEML